MDQLEDGKYYSFNVYAVGYLGTNFKNVKVECTLDYESVRQLNLIDPIEAHQAVYPSISQMGIPDDPKQYRYYKIRFANNTVTAVGIPWIDYSSVVEITVNDYQFTVPSCTPQDINNIRLQLAAINKSIVDAKVLQ